jgi:hypothetical protein
MVIDLGDRIPMAQTSEALPVRLKDLLIDERFLPFYPGEECGAEIKTEIGIIVEDIEDLFLTIDDPRITIGPITLEGDPLVPVMERMGALLTFNGLQPGIFSGWLIEMAMNGYEGIFHFFLPISLFPHHLTLHVSPHKSVS